MKPLRIQIHSFTFLWKNSGWATALVVDLSGSSFLLTARSLARMLPLPGRFQTTKADAGTACASAPGTRSTDRLTTNTFCVSYLAWCPFVFFAQDLDTAIQKQYSTDGHTAPQLDELMVHPEELVVLTVSDQIKRCRVSYASVGAVATGDGDGMYRQLRF